MKRHWLYTALASGFLAASPALSKSQPACLSIESGGSVAIGPVTATLPDGPEAPGYIDFHFCLNASPSIKWVAADVFMFDKARELVAANGHIFNPADRGRGNWPVTADIEPSLKGRRPDELLGKVFLMLTWATGSAGFFVPFELIPR